MRRGHRSIVACSDDSNVYGEKYSTVQSSMSGYFAGDTPDNNRIKNQHLNKILDRSKAGDIDVIHMHQWMECIYDGSFNPIVPVVMTMHVAAGDSGMSTIVKGRIAQRGAPFVYINAISEYQKREYSNLANIYRVIHHGIDNNNTFYKRSLNEKDYLFSIGRITSVKGQDRAIRLAKKTGSKLVIAGCIQNKPEDRAYFKLLKKSIDLCVDLSQLDGKKDYYQNVIKPLLNSGKKIIYIGELNNDQKKVWYEHAIATLFPIRWGEPFGLVAIESMSYGTPVLALNRGALSEIVKDGTTGFIVGSMQEMVGKVKHIAALDRHVSFRHIQKSFSIDRMAHNYSSMYQQIIEEHPYKTEGMVSIHA